MERKKFLKQGLMAVGSIVAIPTLLTQCKETGTDASSGSGSCITSPGETKGPFPIMTPSQLVMANIKSDRTGVALLMNLSIKNKNNNCSALQNVLVDVWHCDKDGNYSEYGGTAMQATNYQAVHFLRGRQTTDANGQVSFISIYPGWYSGRAPHIHVEVLTASGSSLLVTQIAFPENISSTVYASSLYAAHGEANTSNVSDNVFSDSLAAELATVTGNITDGFTLTKEIIVSA
jgi:protocatechuate 3,4-dioxygenase beta subunit